MLQPLGKNRPHLLPPLQQPSCVDDPPTTGSSQRTTTRTPLQFPRVLFRVLRKRFRRSSVHPPLRRHIRLTNIQPTMKKTSRVWPPTPSTNFRRLHNTPACASLVTLSRTSREYDMFHSQVSAQRAGLDTRVCNHDSISTEVMMTLILSQRSDRKKHRTMSLVFHSSDRGALTISTESE